MLPLLIAVIGCGYAPTTISTDAANSQALVSLSCVQSAVLGAGTDVCTVTLSRSAGISGTTVSLAGDNGFVSLPSSITVPAGATTAEFTVNISAVTAPQTATLTASAGGTRKAFAISLGAYAAAMKVSTTSLDFGNVTVMSASSPQTVTVTSTGSAPLTLSGASLAGTGYRMSWAGLPATLNPGQTFTFSISFDPTVAGATSGSLTIYDDASQGRVVVGLSGTGVSTSGGLSTLSCAQTSFTSAGSDLCTVSLSAPAPSGGQAVALSSSDGSVTVPSSVTVPAGASTAGFTATVSAVTAPQTATLTASAGGINKTIAISLGAYAAAMKVSTTSLDFGNVTVMSASSPQTVTLTSTGTAPLTISGASLVATGYRMSWAGLPATLNPGQTLTLSISFDPTAAGTANGNLTIYDNASPSTVVVSLSGTGVSTAGGLSALSCTQTSFTSAGSDLCTVSLSAAAPSGGQAVALSSNNSAVAVPGSITVPAGSTTAGFTAVVSAVTTTQTATLTASAGGVSKAFAVSLAASGPTLTLQTTSVTFGNVTLNSPATQTVSITSSGTTALTISAATVTGTGFSISGLGVPLTLNPGQTAVLNIQFDPTTAGAATGAVTLTSNASPSAATISLSGTGQSNTHHVDLTWNPPTSSTDPAAGYDIYRSTGTSPSYQLLNSSPNQATAYTDSAVQSGSSYSYYVTTVDAQGNESTPSNIATVNIP